MFIYYYLQQVRILRREVSELVYFDDATSW